MFRRNTVFIVGAGASKELGLPIGSELASQISEICGIKFEGGRTTTPQDDQTIQNLQHGAKGASETVDKWLNAMREIQRALPFKDSIDAVIDQFHDRPAVAEVGKYMIARLILQAEAASALAPSEHMRGAPVLSRAQGTWVHSFARMLFEGLRKDKLDDVGANVSIICEPRRDCRRL